MKTFTIILSILTITTNVAFAKNKKYKPVTKENCIEAFDADCPDEDFCEKCNIRFLGHGYSPLMD